MSKEELICKSVDEMANFLAEKFGFVQEVLNRFKDEEIDGEAYFGLTESILINQLKLKAGQMIKIRKHIESFTVMHHDAVISTPGRSASLSIQQQSPDVVTAADMSFVSTPLSCRTATSSTLGTPLTTSSRLGLHDIMEAVKSHPDGRKVIAEYNCTKTIVEHKELFVRIVVGLLIDCNNGSLYPSTEMKQAVAQAVLRDFPHLNSGNQLLAGYDAYFCSSRSVTKCGGVVKKVSASGYIEERLKTLRHKLSPSKKAHKRHVFRKLLADTGPKGDADVEDGMDELCLQISRRLQHEQLADSEVSLLMQESFDGRKAWIQTIMPPICTVFRKFPPLKDILSSHCADEFERLQPGSLDFFIEWEFIAPTIITFAERKSDNAEVQSLLAELHNGGQGMTSSEDGYKPPDYLVLEYATYLLPHILRPPVRKGRCRSSGKEVADSFIRVVPVGSPLETLCESTASPLVIASGTRGNIMQATVNMEGHSTTVPSLLAAVDKAFKIHYLFNIAYCSRSEHIWQFLQKVVYHIFDTTSTFASVLDFQAFVKDKRLRTN